jgi:mono/diheme cytochrome c family protein
MSDLCSTPIGVSKQFLCLLEPDAAFRIDSQAPALPGIEAETHLVSLLYHKRRWGATIEAGQQGAGDRQRCRQRDDTVESHGMALKTGVCLLLWLAACGGRRPQAEVPKLAADRGAVLFQSYCAACHQYDGQGMGKAPPLAGVSWVTGPESRLIKIVLHGLRGPMVVEGQTYDLEMPGFGQVLSDTDVAVLLSYVRRRFGGSAEPIRPETVGRGRAAHPNRTEYWTVEELLRESAP